MMDKEKLFAQIKGGLIVSCQALETEPLYTKEGGVMPLMAKAAAMSGAVGIRANTVRDITQIKQVVDLPVIGIIKKDYPGTPMYITVTMKEVDELVACGVDILAVQGTAALRPNGMTSPEFIKAIKEKYPDQLLMADCDNVENALACAAALKGIEIFQREDYMSKIARIEAISQREMLGFTDPRIKEVRVMGGCTCVEVYDEATLEGFQQFAYERGVFSRPFLKYMYSMVPYVIQEEELVHIFDVMKEWFRRG